MNIGELTGLVAALAAAISAILTVVAFIVRRMSAERRDLRSAQAVNVIQARYLYKIEFLAAQKGWDTDSTWPDKPKELTPEYLEGKAEAEGNPELVDLLRQMTGQGEQK